MKACEVIEGRRGERPKRAYEAIEGQPKAFIVVKGLHGPSSCPGVD